MYVLVSASSFNLPFCIPPISLLSLAMSTGMGSASAENFSIRKGKATAAASDSGAFADWVASSSAGHLSLGFNAGPAAAAGGSASTNAAPSAAAGMWPSASTRLPPEFFFVAPASSIQHHHHHSEAAANLDPYSLNASNAIGVIPLLTAGPCLAQSGVGGGDEDMWRSRASGGGMQLWQQGQNSSAYLIKPMTLEPTNLLQGGGGGNGASSSTTATCQDCGNQAKKDCPHRRCRTCCKSRGFDCSTHVKSTWVPATRRRERQLMGSSQSTSSSKKPRLGGASQTTTTSHTSNSYNTTPPGSFDTSCSHQDASFKESLPGQVRAPAVFKCVRVTAVDDGEDEYAYQAVVRIGGHIFKDFLYDQGVEGRDGLPNLSELHLGGGGRNGASSSSPPVLDHTSDMYAASAGGLLGASTYANPI